MNAYILTVIYTRAFARVVIQYYTNDAGEMESNYSAFGPVSMREVDELIAAEGREVAGWEVTLED